MSSTTARNRSPTAVINDATTPFLSSQNGVSRDGSSRGSMRRQRLREAARFLRRASSRRLMREPSMLVREAAAEQLEERHSDWAYSKPAVVLDVIWNSTFAAVAVGVLVLSWKERPSMPMRLWIIGYALQCLLHMVCVCVEYRRRRRQGGEEYRPFNAGDEGALSTQSRVYSEHYVTLAHLEEDSRRSVAKQLESANTMFSFIWWIIGFYWVSVGGQTMALSSPQLYWLCIVFLGFDVFFVVFCVALACIIGIAVCCCLPCIIAILYVVADQEGASKEDIDQLPKYKFRKIGNGEKCAGDVQGPVGGVIIECGIDSPMERALSEDDAECCICLSAYDDGVELRELPCCHHFHCACVDKWLHINATCPLCNMDPYVLLTCRTQEQKSSVASGKGSEPEWNEDFVFNISEGVSELKLKIMDSDAGSQDDFVGEVTIPLEPVFEEGHLPPAAYNVVKDENYCGEIRIGLTFTPEEHQSRDYQVEESYGGWKQSTYTD